MQILKDNHSMRERAHEALVPGCFLPVIVDVVRSHQWFPISSIQQRVHDLGNIIPCCLLPVLAGIVGFMNGGHLLYLRGS